MAKGGKTTETSKVELPPEIMDAARRTLGLAGNNAALPYAPNFGLQMAAFSPTQDAAFANTNQAAQAYGLPQSSGTGLPQAQNVGGFSGYSTENLYKDALNQVPAQTRSLYEAHTTPAGRARLGADPLAALLNPSSTGTAAKKKPVKYVKSKNIKGKYYYDSDGDLRERR